MKEAYDALINSSDQSQERVLDAMKNMFAAARGGVVFGRPVTVGDQTVIMASEVVSGGGFGFGRGIGPVEQGAHGDETGSSTPPGMGTGGGGGGGSVARPVAVITIGPDGAKVKPVVDVTKIALAALTAWGMMVPMLLRLRRAGRR